MKQIILFVCLAILATACTPFLVPVTATPAPTNLVPAIDLVQQQDAPATVTQEPTPAVDECALISADQALHLRKAPDLASKVLAYLLSGEEVQVISKANADWWQVQAGTLTGYARSKYLTIGDCQGSR